MSNSVISDDIIFEESALVTGHNKIDWNFIGKVSFGSFFNDLYGYITNMSVEIKKNEEKGSILEFYIYIL